MEIWGRYGEVDGSHMFGGALGEVPADSRRVEESGEENNARGDQGKFTWDLSHHSFGCSV
jgi:hypothetical protein